MNLAIHGTCVPAQKGSVMKCGYVFKCIAAIAFAAFLAGCEDDDRQAGTDAALTPDIHTIFWDDYKEKIKANSASAGYVSRTLELGDRLIDPDGVAHEIRLISVTGEEYSTFFRGNPCDSGLEFKHHGTRVYIGYGNPPANTSPRTSQWKDLTNGFNQACSWQGYASRVGRYVSEQISVGDTIVDGKGAAHVVKGLKVTVMSEDGDIPLSTLFEAGETHGERIEHSKYTLWSEGCCSEDSAATFSLLQVFIDPESPREMKLESLIQAIMDGMNNKKTWYAYDVAHTLACAVKEAVCLNDVVIDENGTARTICGISVYGGPDQPYMDYFEGIETHEYIEHTFKPAFNPNNNQAVLRLYHGTSLAYAVPPPATWTDIKAELAALKDSMSLAGFTDEFMAYASEHLVRGRVLEDAAGVKGVIVYVRVMHNSSAIYESGTKTALTFEYSSQGDYFFTSVGISCEPISK